MERISRPQPGRALDRNWSRLSLKTGNQGVSSDMATLISKLGIFMAFVADINCGRDSRITRLRASSVIMRPRVENSPSRRRYHSPRVNRSRDERSGSK